MTPRHPLKFSGWKHVLCFGLLASCLRWPFWLMRTQYKVPSPYSDFLDGLGLKKCCLCVGHHSVAPREARLGLAVLLCPLDLSPKSCEQDKGDQEYFSTWQYLGLFHIPCKTTLCTSKLESIHRINTCISFIYTYICCKDNGFG